jgi:hypothetical protein
MARAADILRSPFAFLFTRSRKEEVVAEYVIREHHQGRALDEILRDSYVSNRLSPAQAERLLDRADVLNAVGADMVEAHRAAQGEADSS